MDRTEFFRRVAVDCAQACPKVPELFPLKVARHELEEAQLRSTAKALEESECSGMTAGPQESATEYAQRRARENDAQALRMQVEQGRAWGLL